MNVFAVSFVGLAAAFLSLSLRRYNAEISSAVAIAGGAVIFLYVIINLTSVFDEFKAFFSASSVDSKYITILIKALGICFLTEFAGDCCLDAGQRALANNVITAGKALVLMSALPMYKDALDCVLSLTGNAV